MGKSYAVMRGAAHGIGLPRDCKRETIGGTTTGHGRKRCLKR